MLTRSVFPLPLHTLLFAHKNKQRWLLLILLLAAFVLSALSAASCNFMNFITVSDEAFAMSNTDATTGKVTGVEDAGQIDASDFEDGDEEASVDEEIQAAAEAKEADEDEDDADEMDADEMAEMPVCGEAGDKAEECGAEPEEGRPTTCCDGLVCDGKKCSDGGRMLAEFHLPAEKKEAERRNLQSAYTTGIFRYPDPTRGDTCMTYPDSQTFDRAERAARAGAALAPLICCVVVLFLLFECLFCNVPCLKCLLGMLLLTATICQGLTYLMLASTSFCSVNTVRDFYFELRDSKPCTVSQGGIYSAFATLSYFLALVVLTISPKPEPVFCSGSGKDVNLRGADFRDEEGKAWTDPDAGTMT